MKTLVWEGCYDEGWKGIIPDAAFEHPAKFSKRLLERILDHMEARGWIEKGMMIADPFGGVRLGGVVCAYRGYQWLGVELEQRFMDLGEQVFGVHRGRWDALGVPQPVCVQGDSRQFHELIKKAADVVVSSPPYVSGGHHNDVFEAWNTNGRGQNGRGDLHGYGKTDGQIAQLKEGSLPAVVSSPPFQRSHGGERGIMVDGLHTKDGRHHKGFAKRQYRDGERAEGNIEDAKHGSVDVVMSSPPYDVIAAGAGGLNTKPAKHDGQQSGRKAGASQTGDQRYGESEGQIARCKKGELGAVLSSPPYEDSMNHAARHGFDFNKGEWQKHDPVTPGRARARERSHSNRSYGNAKGQIGKLKKQTYWEAMLEVYSSCYLAMRPGGVMAIVVKDFVKNGKRQRLCDDTLRLLNHVGFETLERVHAKLVRHYVEPDLFEGERRKTKTRKSFFRRQLESKMAPDDPRRIDEEEVLFVQKPKEQQ